MFEFLRRKNAPDYSTMSEEVLNHNINQAREDLIRIASTEEKLEHKIERSIDQLTSTPVLIGAAAITGATAFASVKSTELYVNGMELGVNDSYMLVAGIAMFALSAASGIFTVTGIIDRLRNRRADTFPDTLPTEFTQE